MLAISWFFLLCKFVWRDYNPSLTTDLMMSCLMHPMALLMMILLMTGLYQHVLCQYARKYCRNSRVAATAAAEVAIKWRIQKEAISGTTPPVGAHQKLPLQRNICRVFRAQRAHGRIQSVCQTAGDPFYWVGSHGRRATPCERVYNTSCKCLPPKPNTSFLLVTFWTIWTEQNWQYQNQYTYGENCGYGASRLMGSRF